MIPRRAAGIRLFVAVALLAVGLLTLAPTVGAHADFITSSPAAYDIWNVVPGSISVTVSEAVQPGSQTIVVTNLTGARVDVGSTQLSPADPTTFRIGLRSGIGPSVYTVTWAVVSADDGHFTAGTFYFMVSYRDGALPGRFPRTGALDLAEPVSPLDIALEATDFVGFSIAFGGVLLVGFVWAPLGSALEPADRRSPTDGFRALLRFARLGAVVFAAAVAGLWVENLILVPPSSVAGIIGSTFLLARALQVAVGAALVVLLTNVLHRVSPDEAFAERPWEFLPLTFLGFSSILLEVAASHSASAATGWPLGPAANAIHLYGAALWVGGLFAILRARPWLRPPTPLVFSRELLAAFSRFAFLGVLLVVSAGSLLGIILVGTLGGLLGTTYGWVILAKGALLVPMVALGAWNRRTLRRDAADKPRPETVETLGRRVRLEAALGAVILVLAGALVTINPAAAPQPQNPTFLLETTNGTLSGIFRMNPYPATPGDYFFQLEVYYAGNGTPFVGGGNGTLSFFLEGGNGSWATIALNGPHGNHYYVESPVLDVPGTWQIQARVQGPSGSPVTLPFTVTLHP